MEVITTSYDNPSQFPQYMYLPVIKSKYINPIKEN